MAGTNTSGYTAHTHDSYSTGRTPRRSLTTHYINQTCYVSEMSEMHVSNKQQTWTKSGPVTWIQVYSDQPLTDEAIMWQHSLPCRGTDVIGRAISKGDLVYGRCVCMYPGFPNWTLHCSQRFSVVHFNCDFSDQCWPVILFFFLETTGQLVKRTINPFLLHLLTREAEKS